MLRVINQNPDSSLIEALNGGQGKQQVEGIEGLLGNSKGLNGETIPNFADLMSGLTGDGPEAMMQLSPEELLQQSEQTFKELQKDSAKTKVSIEEALNQNNGKIKEQVLLENIDPKKRSPIDLVLKNQSHKNLETSKMSTDKAFDITTLTNQGPETALTKKALNPIKGKGLNSNNIVEESNLLEKVDVSKINKKNNLGIYQKEVEKQQSSILGNKNEQSDLNTEQVNHKPKMKHVNQNSLMMLGAGASVTPGANEGHSISMNGFKVDESKGVDALSQQIMDYIKQNAPFKTGNLEVRFTHEAVGDVTLNVTEVEKGQFNIQIAPTEDMGIEFFKQHKGKIVDTLASSGLNVKDFNISKDSSSSWNFNKGSSQGDFYQDSQERNDSEKRRELWNLFQDQEAA